MTQRLLFMAWICALSLSLNAQSVISGTIVDSVEQKPLPAATIQVLSANGSIIKSEKTNDKGYFKITTPHISKGKIIISHINFQPLEITLPLEIQPTYDLGILYLLPQSYSLAAVVVEGRKAPVLFKVDRQVYKSSQFTNAANGTAVDVIRNLPAISVDANGTISFRGSNSFLVLINGKPTQGDPSFVLSQLPAGAIEDIELITSPSAAYDADGKSGIINIVTKDSVEDGWIIQANLMGGAPPINDFDNKRYNHPKRYGFDVLAGYNKNKWNINAGINYLRNDLAGFREGDVYTIIDEVKTSFPSTGERSYKRYNYGARMAVDFQANSSNTFSTGFYIGKKYQSRVADLLYHNSRENLNTGAITYFNYFNENTQNKEGIFTLANLDYIHTFEDNSKISFSGLFEQAKLSGTTYNLNLQYPQLIDTIQYTVNPSTNPLKAYRGKVDYSKDIANGNLQIGYQYRYDIQNGDFLYLTKINGSNDFETDPTFPSKVDVKSHIHGGYVQYSGRADKLNYSAGLRLEHSERNLYFSQSSENNKLSLTNLFPSVQLRYAAWNKGVIKAGYNRRIKRTNNYELNPFPEREHSETLEQGDPNLLPELTGTYELGVEQGLKRGNFFITLYHQRILNPIQRVNKVFNDTILNRVFTNAGKATQTGVEANLDWQLTHVWRFLLGGNLYKYKIKGAIFHGTIPVNNQKWVYSINSTQSFALPKNWLLQLSVNYLSLRATAQGEDGAFLTPHFTVKKTTTGKRWYFQLQWLNIDAGMKISNRQRITTWGNDFYTTTNYIYEPDQLQLSVGFNLLRKNRKIKLPQSEIGEKEF